MNFEFPCPIAGTLLVAALAVGQFAHATDRPLPIFDAHIHYSEDVWDRLPPEKAIAWLTRAGIEKALVSGTPTEGAERLYREAPERVVPFLRPYPSRAHRTNWFDDPDIPGYVLEQLDRIPYQGIGEFHVFGEDAESHTARQVIRIASQRKLALHAHTDADGMLRILAQAPDTTVIWAHAGFDVPVEALHRMLRDHPNLILELSFREGITRDGELTETWRTFFTGYPRRFLVGMDTYTPGRWADLEELARASRGWLGQLPDDVAQRIANGNAESLFRRGSDDQQPDLKPVRTGE